MVSWERILKESISRRTESLPHLIEELFESVIVDEQSESDKNKSEINQKNVADALEKIKNFGTREWIIWTRLTLFPTSFVGRIQISSNSPWDVNAKSDVKLENYYSES